jgi:hypothetical protein
MVCRPFGWKNVEDVFIIGDYAYIYGIYGICFGGKHDGL